jgi:hypothetical protein
VGAVALDVEQRRRRIDGGKRGRIAGLDGEKRTRADRFRRLQLRLRPISGQMRIAFRPPRRDSSGNAARAGSAPPK